MPNNSQRDASRARQTMYAALRAFFLARGFEEVETPLLVAAPGMEPHIQAFEVPFIPETDLGRRRPLYLHTSPEYAMKRLLADGYGPVFQICKVFRNGEVSQTHNPEFTMLELYRPNADYEAIMRDVEEALLAVERALGVTGPFSRAPFERVTVRDAVLKTTGVDLFACRSPAELRQAAEAVGVRVGSAERFEDVFFHLFLTKVEPTLGVDRPTFLTEYPSEMASLARLKPQDARVAERFELYGGGMELANGFSELTDGEEQRRRLVEEQALRTELGKPVYPLDERFLDAVGRMPPSGGVAVGLDRVLMAILGQRSISEVLLFPAHDFV
jgi:lysyl-tRNA synthetase class 2